MLVVKEKETSKDACLPPHSMIKEQRHYSL